MNQWIQTINGKWYWLMTFTAEEIILLRKYHKAISRMTKLNFDKIVERYGNE